MKKNIGLWILVGIVGGAVLGGLYIYALMSLWNWLIPLIFNGPVITFWQTAGLLLLVCMFGWVAFGKGGGGGCWGGCRGGRHRYWKSKWNDKWANMSEEEKQKWKDSMHCCW
ncbi:MAG TPA: HMG-box domain-containing protein [Flavobacteriales bacterium]|nr:HMG-box domain-containing protein [Flavobacteriales bacterium]